MTQLLDILTTFGYRLLILAAFATASAALTFLSVWLKAKADETKTKLRAEMSQAQRDTLDAAIRVAAQAAQQVLADNGAKLAYVKGVALQAAQALGITITDSQLSVLIESAVYLLKQEELYFKK